MRLRNIFLILILGLTLSGCGKTKEKLGQEELVSMKIKKENPSDFDLEEFCRDNGGHYETWKDGEVFCMFKGYGCEPSELYFDRCGMGI